MKLPWAIWLAVFSCAAGASVAWRIANDTRDDELLACRSLYVNQGYAKGYRTCLSEQDEDKPKRGR